METTSTKNLNTSSLTTALDRLRKGIAWQPDDSGWLRQIQDSMYRDCLSTAKGDQERALHLMIDLMAGTLGEMVWRLELNGMADEEIIRRFNKCAARHEGAFKLKLVVEPHEAKKAE